MIIRTFSMIALKPIPAIPPEMPALGSPSETD